MTNESPPEHAQRDTSDSTGSRSGGDRLGGLLLLAALGVGLVRFVRLGEWSLWIDEAFTLADVASAGNFSNPLGYWITGWVLESLGGRTDEAALRLTAAVFGFLCVPLVAWAFRPALGLRGSSLAALILAASSWHLYWSQSARFYTLAMAIALLGSGIVMRSFKRGGAPLYAAGIAITGLSGAAHPTGVFVLPGLLAVPVLAARLGAPVASSIRRTAFVIGLVGMLASLGWLVDVAGEWGSIKSGGDTAHFVLTTGFYLTPLLGIAALLGAISAVAERRQPAMALLLLVPVLTFGFGLVVSTQLRMTAQYVFMLLPWACGLAAVPVAQFASTGSAGRMLALRFRGPWEVGAWSAVLVLPALATCLLYLGPRHGERPRWRDAYATVFREAGPDDLIVGMAAPVGEYYLGAGRTDVRRLQDVVYLDPFRYEVLLDWDRYPRRTWFVVNHEEFEDWPDRERANVERILREQCHLVEQFPLIVESRDLSVAVYLRP